MISLGAPNRRDVAPLNAYPFWKYLFVLLVVALGALYALPNLYPPDYAVQISPRSEGIAADPDTLALAEDALGAASVEYFGTVIEGDRAIIRFPSNEAQIRGRDRIDRALLEAGLTDDFLVVLDLASTTPAWLDEIGAQRMNYGLDLSGGVHFLLEVDMEKAVADRLEAFAGELRVAFREERIRYRRPLETDPSERTVSVRFADPETRDAARALMFDRLGEFEMSSLDDEAPGLRFTLSEQAVRAREDYAISQNLQSLRNRVNELGVSEPLVQRLGRDRIVLDLPGLQDPGAAKGTIGKVANLEFRLEARPDALRSETEAFDYSGRSVDLEQDIILTGDNVSDANVGFDPETSLPQVNITLDGEGGSRMTRATTPSVGRRMAVIFKETKTNRQLVRRDGVETEVVTPYEVERVISLATIQSPLGNRFRITGLSQGEAAELSLLLRAGALAAPMYIVEERTVGASLGEDNIRAGFLSVAVGFALVMVFMLVYYRLFGLAANIALAANLLLIVAVMSLLGATLTLPGIAGIVLTVGMAVDANVLIFARIREELGNRPPQQAISAGFDRAFVTILDANITTFLVAIILYAIGSGPVKGFAVTLAIGIVTSMFTAIVGTRALVNLIYGGRNVTRLAI
ncbi:MAG: protein translocase subunit SecD [Pseudomonadales bacterium]|nr:protein translocase subunit SecD [Pseudomonadales bacterium]